MPTIRGGGSFDLRQEPPTPQGDFVAITLGLTTVKGSVGALSLTIELDEQAPMGGQDFGLINEPRLAPTSVFVRDSPCRPFE
jgi:hypothetical protein